MSSPARQIANSVNAKRSTGPRTEQGKARSSQNARTHGLSATQLVISVAERQEFEDLRTQLRAEIKPHGPLQDAIFDELVTSAWNLRRIRRMETELTAAQSITAMLEDTDLAAKLDRIARYHTRIERTFYRSLRELKALQTDAVLTITLPAYFMRTVPPLASRAQIAKRTQSLALGDRRNGVDDGDSGADAEEEALRFAARAHEALAAAAGCSTIHQ
jgi:hypothetical protein